MTDDTAWYSQHTFKVGDVVTHDGYNIEEKFVVVGYTNNDHGFWVDVRRFDGLDDYDGFRPKDLTLVASPKIQLLDDDLFII